MITKIIGIIGCGTMGSGIARICAQAGFKTIIKEVSYEFVERGKKSIIAKLNRDVEKRCLSSDERDAVLSRVSWTTELNGLLECNFVIEAMIEDIDLKKKLFRELGDITNAEIPLASNTSSYSITELASVTRCPERVIGLHFFYPVAAMKLVEVVKTDITSQVTVNEVLELAGELGKETITVSDRPGFLVNRLLFPYFLDCIRVLDERLGSIEDIDKAMTAGAGFPIGPFRLLDHLGLDMIYYVASSLYNELKEKRFAPPPLLKRMVMSGHFGRKTGKGFYDYKEEN